MKFGSFYKALFVSAVAILLAYLQGKSQETSFSDVHSLYWQTGINTGNYNVGFSSDLNYIYKSRYSLQVGYSGFFKHPDSEPNDYSTGLVTLFSFGLERVYDQVHNWNLLVGHLIPLNHSETLRLHVRAGGAYSRRLIPINWAPVQGAGITENYGYDYLVKTGPALVFNVELQWAYLQFLGHSLDAVLMMRDNDVFVGIGISGSLGLLRPR